MRKRILAGNWKMNHGPEAARAFFLELETLTPAGSDFDSIERVIFAPMLSLQASLEAARSQKIWIGSQNTHFEKSGAFTGEVSGPMLAELGIRWSLTGHSERRQHFGETDETVFKRTISLLEQGFEVMACIGETRSERESNQTEAVLARQLASLLQARIAPFCDGRLTIAYEPVWAIGTGLTATPAQAQEAHGYCRKKILELVGPAASEKTRILYGGSVTTENISELLRCPDVDGGLVGGASLKSSSFSKLTSAFLA
jgi:triosephosphate isomerase